MGDLLTRWRGQAQRLTGRTPQAIAEGAQCVAEPPLCAEQISPGMLDRVAESTLEDVVARRSTWTPRKRADRGRPTARGMRMASSVDHLALVDGVTAAVLAQSVPLVSCAFNPLD